MSRLEDAIRAAAARKRAVLSRPDDADDEIGISFTTAHQSRLVISGFDIDYDELHACSRNAGQLFAQLSLNLLPAQSHEAAWTEGFLIGLFAGSLPPASDAGDTDVTSSGDASDD